MKQEGHSLSLIHILYNQMILIGHMEPGETVSLDGMKVIYGITNFGYAMAEQTVSYTHLDVYKRQEQGL